MSGSRANRLPLIDARVAPLFASPRWGEAGPAHAELGSAMADRVRGEFAIEVVTPHPLAPLKHGSRPLPVHAEHGFAMTGEVKSALAAGVKVCARRAGH
jgi:hypothetical protein